MDPYLEYRYPGRLKVVAINCAVPRKIPSLIRAKDFADWTISHVSCCQCGGWAEWNCRCSKPLPKQMEFFFYDSL
jgi:hypothetical protein